MTDRARILPVEDDDGIREGVTECLAAEGYEVAPAANGVEALSWLARERRPDAIVVDLIMPVMGGGEFLTRLRALPQLRDVPVLLMTAALPTPSMPMPDANAILVKPFELDQLLEAVQRVSARAA